MTKYSEEELNNLNKEDLVKLLLETQNEYFRLAEQNTINVMNRFSRSSEKMEIEGQLSFNEAEAEVNYVAKEPEIDEVITVAAHKRKAGKRKKDLEGIESEVIDLTLSDEKLKEIFGDKGYKCLPDEVYKRLNYQPAKVNVLEYHVHVYAGKDNETIVRADRPVDLLRNSIVTPSLLSAIINNKYVNAMPLYRTEQEMKRNDINISRQTMANWINICSDKYAKLIYKKIREKVLEGNIIQADETPVIVNKDGRPAGSKSYMWVYRTGQYNKDKPAILYEYQKTRKAEHPEKFLKNFKGYLVCDGYQAYHKIDGDRDDIKVAGCWTHLRRRFENVVKSASGPDKERIKESFAYRALRKVSKIYHIEEKFKDSTAEERLKNRSENIRPLVEDFFAWIHENEGKILKNSETGKGFEYAINQEQYLNTFLENGDIPIDNNAAEQSIRPFCIGKKNWVMIDTENGADSSAILYSIAETAKANNLKPYEYFKLLFTEIPKHVYDSDQSYLDHLLPWSADLPDECRKKLYI